MAAPFARGQHCKVLFIQDNNEVHGDCIKWELGPNVTKFSDGVNGEIRDRVGKATNFYELSFTFKMVDMTQLVSLLADQSNEDAGVVPLDKSTSIIITPPNGNKSAFTATNLVIDDWKLSSQSRTDRLDLVIPMRADDLTQVPSL